MFKFNFGNESNNSEKEGKFMKLPTKASNGSSERRDDVINWYECRKIEVEAEIIEKLKNPGEEMINLNYEGGINVTCLSPIRIISKLKSGPGNTISDVLEAEKNHSDLIPGKYEGGLKIWECTKDLVNYLAINLTEPFLGKKVLDLGCGAGIIGIVAALKGASVTFQDYNHEVIDLITMPNVFLNMNDIDAMCSKTEFFCGDWGSFLDYMMKNGKTFEQENETSVKKAKVVESAKKFDFILSSETIYNPDNYVKICRIVKELMKDNGVCYIAAKKCYFGVGGNTHCFTEYLKKECIFNIETCWSSDEGNSPIFIT